MKVEFFTVEHRGRTVYDLRLLDPKATVADYLQAFNKFVETRPIQRNRAAIRQCKGCDRCCYERIPLTYIDVLNLYQHLYGCAPTDQQLLAFLASHAYIYVEGQVVDISLARLDDEGCFFLDRVSRTCRVYPARPLVCQTYLCAPSSSAFTSLRNRIVNLGEDELVRQALLAARRLEQELYYHEAWQPAVRLADWNAGPFADKKDYAEIELQQFLKSGF